MRRWRVFWRASTKKGSTIDSLSLNPLDEVESMTKKTPQKFGVSGNLFLFFLSKIPPSRRGKGRSGRRRGGGCVPYKHRKRWEPSYVSHRMGKRNLIGEKLVRVYTWPKSHFLRLQCECEKTKGHRDILFFFLHSDVLVRFGLYNSCFCLPFSNSNLVKYNYNSRVCKMI